MTLCKLSCSHHTTGKGGNTDDQCQGGGNQLKRVHTGGIYHQIVPTIAEAIPPNPFSKATI